MFIIHKAYVPSNLSIVDLIASKKLFDFLYSNDIKFTIKEDVRSILETYDADLPTWEHVQYIFKNKVWGTTVILKRDVLEEETQGKMLSINGPTEISIETFITQNWMDKE